MPFLCWISNFSGVALRGIARNSQEILISRSRRNRNRNSLRRRNLRKSPWGLTTLPNEFEQILTRYLTFRATTEDANNILRWRETSFPLNFHIQLRLGEVEWFLKHRSRCILSYTFSCISSIDSILIWVLITLFTGSYMEECRFLC